MDPPNDSIDGLGLTFSNLGRADQLLAIYRSIQTSKETIMGRFEELQATVDSLRTELQEEAASGRAAIGRLVAVITTLTDQVATLTAGQVTDDQLAQLNASAAAAKAEADAVESEFDATGQPPAPPA